MSRERGEPWQRTSSQALAAAGLTLGAEQAAYLGDLPILLSSVVPMTERLAAALAALRHLRGPRVLVQDDGTELSTKVLRSWVKSPQRLAGLKPTGNFHILRHAFCSHLAMRGAPAKAIQELAGHTHLTTTMRYMHLAEGHKEQAIRLLDHRPAAAPQGGRVEAGLEAVKG